MEIVSQLLLETIEIAQEEGFTDTSSKFSKFVLDMLPLDIIDTLREIYGSEDFIDDIWHERYEVITRIGEDDAGEVLEHGHCLVCERKVRLTKHHLYPRETHKRKAKQGISEINLQETIAICRMCHSTIHRFFTNDILADEYFTLDRLLSNERFYRYARWAAAQSGKRNGKVR